MKYYVFYYVKFLGLFLFEDIRKQLEVYFYKWNYYENDREVVLVILILRVGVEGCDFFEMVNSFQ